jgi:hypothetical protein
LQYKNKQDLKLNFSHMRGGSTLPFPTHPQVRPVSLLAVFPLFFDLPAGRRGCGSLLSGMGNIVLSNIWRNEYQFADLSMLINPYLPRESLKKIH